MTSDTSWVDSMPAVYDRALGPALFAPFAVYVGEAAAALAPRRLLELAAGTGIATAELVAALPDTEIAAFLTRIPYGYHAPELIAADLRACGLEPVAIERVVLRGTASSATAVAEGFCLGPPLQFELQARGDLNELTAAVAIEVMSRLGLGSVEGDLAAFVVTARRP